MIRGPYWTGAFTPSGDAAFVSQPHPHFTVSIWCSVVTVFTGGTSMTCLRSTAVTGAFLRDFPQQPHLAGRCFTFLSGCSDSSIVVPGWPCGRPGLRPDLPRSDFGDGLAGPSDDGGLLELREFVFTWAARSAACDCSAVTRSRSAAISASRSASSSRSRVFAARSPASPLSGTPGVSGTDEHCHDSFRPANRQPSKQHSSRESTGDEGSGQTDLSSYDSPKPEHQLPVRLGLLSPICQVQRMPMRVSCALLAPVHVRARLASSCRRTCFNVW